VPVYVTALVAVDAHVEAEALAAWPIEMTPPRVTAVARVATVRRETCVTGWLQEGVRDDRVLLVTTRQFDAGYGRSSGRR
jgi:hypothetical protein